ncbi:MAG: hypothetical protein ACLTWE_10680 [Dysgonomonas mossii]|uniref:hypothetical protein n=1 Tax=Dysgonomonas mossii TaxID=163665 RepID=UPI0039919AB9
MAKKKKRGHYCRICGASKPNEAFSGKGHTKHICKECSSLPQKGKVEQPEIEIDDDYIFDDADIDCLPVFSEKKKFSELDSYEKMVLRDYIRSEITEHLEYVKKIPTETELIEMRKRMMSFFDEEHNILLKKDTILRKFFEDNAASMINKLQRNRN